jgi:hypothetical protein
MSVLDAEAAAKFSTAAALDARDQLSVPASSEKEGRVAGRQTSRQGSRALGALLGSRHGGVMLCLQEIYGLIWLESFPCMLPGLVDRQSADLSPVVACCSGGAQQRHDRARGHPRACSRPQEQPIPTNRRWCSRQRRQRRRDAAVASRAAAAADDAG